MKALSRRGFLRGFAGVAAGMCFCPGGIRTAMGGRSRGGRKPNIIMIMIDDLGWMDVGCQGNSRLETPNIDRLAAEGMRFTDAYAAAPVCSPTRAAVMTGQSPARLKITNHLPDRESFAPKGAKWKSAKTVDHLGPEYVTVAERLKEAGYATAFMGKWHLSGRAGRGGLGVLEYEPQYQGFDVNIGGCAYGGPPTYFDPYGIHNIEPRKKGEYLPDRLADETVAFMKANRAKPFFVALWNYTVHWPMEAPADLIKKYEGRVGPGLKDIRYAAMIEAMDSAVGDLMGQLKELGLADDTVVVFTSDNGGFGGVSDCRPLRESKGYLYDGGIRVPFIVWWPGVVKAGAECDVPVVLTDLYPTFLQIAGLRATAGQVCDGESLVGLWSGRGGLKREAVYFHYPNYAWHGSNRLGAAVRAGDYKLLEWFDDGSVELYNMREDIGEKRDLAKKMPGRAAKLKGMLDAWLEETEAEMPTKIKD